ncbi:MAG: hypothetical protein J3Q66DRAFT_291014, partial [Benniella sp.]
GPFPITEKGSPVAFRLELPEHMKIHSFFHTSLLKHEQELPPEFQDREPPRPPSSDA